MTVNQTSIAQNSTSATDSLNSHERRMTVANQTIIAESTTLARDLLNNNGNIEAAYYPKWGRMVGRILMALPMVPLIGMSTPLYLTAAATGVCFLDYLLDHGMQDKIDIKLIELKLGKLIDQNSADTTRAAFAKIFQQKTYDVFSKYYSLGSRIKLAATVGFALATWANFNRLDSNWASYSTGTRDICCLTAGLAIAIPAIVYGIYHEMAGVKLANFNKDKAKLFTEIDNDLQSEAS